MLCSYMCEATTCILVLPWHHSWDCIENLMYWTFNSWVSDCGPLTFCFVHKYEYENLENLPQQIERKTQTKHLLLYTPVTLKSMVNQIETYTWPQHPSRCPTLTSRPPVVHFVLLLVLLLHWFYLSAIRSSAFWHATACADALVFASPCVWVCR